METCSPLPGALTSDTVTVGFNPLLQPGVILFGEIDTSGNNVTVTAFNANPTAVTVQAGLLRVDAWRH